VAVIVVAGSSLVVRAIRSMMDPVNGGCDEVSDASCFSCCLLFVASCKGQILLGPVPRNFLVLNVTRKSPTSYRLVARKSVMSPACYEEVNDVTRDWSQWNLALTTLHTTVLSKSLMSQPLY